MLCPSSRVFDFTRALSSRLAIDFARALSFEACHWCCLCFVLRGLSLMFLVLCLSSFVIVFAGDLSLKVSP